jgi:flagellar hook-associated protein 3 FlgL
MRVTDSIRQDRMRQAQARASENVLSATETAVSGLRVRRPEDDPAAYAAVSVHDAAIARLSARQKNLETAASNATAAESALAQASDIVARARDLAVQLADGSVSASERATGAKEVAALRQALVGVANTKGSAGYLFAGANVDSEPFNSAGVFSGNDASLAVEVGDNLTMRSNSSGAMAFTALGGRDILQDLADLETALTTNNLTGIQLAVNTMGQGHTQVVRARADAGVILDRLNMAQELAFSALNVSEKAKQHESEADLTEAYSELVSANGAYERALEIARRSMQSFDIKSFG